MFRKITIGFCFLFLIAPLLVNASMGSLVKVGNKYYDSLEDAIKNVGPNDTISLISDVKLDDTLVIDKIVNLNLNGNDITAPERVFLVQNGKLNITGKGTIRETTPNYGAIMVKGSDNSNDNDYSILNVGKDVTLEGWSGIFINQNNTKAYGVEVNFSGTINAVDDKDGNPGAGIYSNGQIKDKNNSPVININDNAKITSTGNGIYMAGYGTLNINAATISGDVSGIGIKSGILNIDGANIYSNGKDATPTPGNNNGINASGTAIQIESNSNYAGNIEINIDDGKFTSKNSNVIYEYIGKGDHSQLTALDISGGNFSSNSGKDVFNLSDSLKEFHGSFISGGNYSTNPDSYLKTGYKVEIDDDRYVVTEAVMKEVMSSNNDDSSTNIVLIITLVILSLLGGTFIILRKNKVINI